MLNEKRTTFTILKKGSVIVMKTKVGIIKQLKRVIYRKIDLGICAIYDLKGSRYFKRKTGIKFHTYIKSNGDQYAKSFKTLKECRLWRKSMVNTFKY